MIFFCGVDHLIFSDENQGKRYTNTLLQILIEFWQWDRKMWACSLTDKLVNLDGWAVTFKFLFQERVVLGHNHINQKPQRKYFYRFGMSKSWKRRANSSRRARISWTYFASLTANLRVGKGQTFILEMGVQNSELTFKSVHQIHQ